MGLFFDYENVKVGECIICGKDITVDQEVKQKVTVNGSLTGKQLADDCYICDRCAQKYSLEKKELNLNYSTGKGSTLSSPCHN